MNKFFTPQKLKPPIIIVLIVWGDNYIDLLFKVSFPSQLTEGNLPSLSKKYEVKYMLYTTSEDRKNIESHPLFIELKKHSKIHFIKIESDANPHKYSIMTACHAHAVKSVKNSPLLFLNPDVIYSNGTFEYLKNKIDEGKRVVMVPGIRLAKERFLSLIENEKNFVYESRLLASYALRSLHPASESLCWENQQINVAPYHIYWKLGEEGLLIRGFHQHPIMMWPENTEYPQDNIDGDYVQKACPNIDRWEIITNSDQFFICELIPTKDLKISTKKKDLLSIASWIRRATIASHRKFVIKKIVIHSGIDVSKYSDTLRLSDITIHALLELCLNPGIRTKIISYINNIWTKFKGVLVKKLIRNGNYKISEFTK